MATAAEQERVKLALVNAQLKAQPQAEGISALKESAHELFANSVAAGKSEGTLEGQAAGSAVAPTAAIFSQAAQQGAAGRALSAPALASLLASSPFRAAAANEQAAGTERSANSEASALSRLQDEKVAAAETPAFTHAAALSQLASELSKIRAKETSLLGTEGLDVTSEIGKQREAAQKLGVTERGQTLSHEAAEAGHSASERNSERSTSTAERDTLAHDQTAREDAALTHGTGAAGVKPLTTAEQNTGLSLIKEIQHYAGEAGKTRAERVAALTEGQPEQSTKNSKGETVKVPKIPAFKPNVLMSAALDVAEHGRLTRSHEAALERAGYNVARLGLPKALTPQQEGAQENPVGKSVLSAVEAAERARR